MDGPVRFFSSYFLENEPGRGVHWGDSSLRFYGWHLLGSSSFLFNGLGLRCTLLFICASSAHLGGALSGSFFVLLSSAVIVFRRLGLGNAKFPPLPFFVKTPPLIPEGFCRAWRFLLHLKGIFTPPPPFPFDLSSKTSLKVRSPSSSLRPRSLCQARYHTSFSQLLITNS